MMLRKIIMISLLLVSGCVSYKELQPIPELTPSEGLFQPLKNQDENFLLEKGNKYIIKFPRPTKNDYYLVLLGLKKPLIYTNLENFFDAEAETVLTRSFGFREGGVQQIPDEQQKSDSLSLYSIDSMSTYYVWKIDTVKADLELKMQYRYVYQWRYIFENDYSRFQIVMRDNKADRTVYNNINPDFNFANIDFVKSIAHISPRKKNLQAMREKLSKLESIFPSDIMQSADTAYATYNEFCAEVDDELMFQNNYLGILNILKKEKETQGDVVAFLKSAPEFTKFITGMKTYPIPIVKKVKQVFSARLAEVIPYYEAALKKPDLNVIGPYPELDNAEDLFLACDKQIPSDYGYLTTFVKRFVEERDAFGVVENNLTDLNAMAENVSDRPSESFYRTVLSILEQNKNIMPESEARRVEKYGKYKCAVLLDQKINNASKFVDIMAEQVPPLRLLDSKLRVINNFLEAKTAWPSDTLYVVIVNNIEEIKNNIPKAATQRIDPYSDSKIALWVNKRIANIAKQVNESQPRFQKAAMLVPQINAFRAQENYRGIIRLLNSNRNLGFLLAQYPEVDSLSLYNQSKVISNFLSNNTWPSAESKIDELYRDKDYLNFNAIADRKNQLVKQYENDLFQKVNQTSRSAAEMFISKNISVLSNIPNLYKDSAFIPVYNLTFTTTTQKDLIQKNKQIEKYLTEMKNIRFPEAAIKTLYRELTQNTQDQGVQKARAIVDHGKLYRGSDKQVKGLVDECDYSVPKSILKPSEYRKFFALPSTSNKKGNNDYLIRLKLNIPSEAEFPIFDVNITVPQELIQDDDNVSWFDEITINKKQIKSEGRFHITAPNASNNYESQITPVQIDKSVDNIFEIKFKYAGFKVFEISAMVQKPIIRKN